MQPLLLGEGDLEGLAISTSECVEAIEDAVRADLAGTLWTAPKSAVLPGDGRYMMTTLAAGGTSALTVVKSVTVSPRNPARGLDTIEGYVYVQDAETGLLRAIMGAKWLTRVRTAGLSAVAARRLANPDARILTAIGAGTQARGHLQAFAELYPLQEIRILGRGQSNIDRLVTLAQDLDVTPRICSDPKQAVDGADLVVSSIPATARVSPFIDARWLKPGAFAAITDLAIPWLAAGMKAFGTAFIDDRRQEAALAKPMIDPRLVTGDLAELVSGPASRYDPDRPSTFTFRGLAVADFALAALVDRQARRDGIGKTMPI